MPTHFTQAEREILYRLRFQEGCSLRHIARTLSKSHSSVSRELRRNQNNYLGYLPDRAQAMAQARTKKRVLLWWEKNPDLLVEILEKLLDGWSPELIAITRAQAGRPTVCYESMYDFLYSPRAKAMGWHRLLRYSHARRKKRMARKAHRTHIPDRVGIETRPAVVAERIQVGHWEADSVVFSKQRAGVSVALERKSRYVILTKIHRKTAEATNAALARLAQFPCHTLTVDNGAEFTQHKQLPMPVYFCAPYHSWEKGSVEQVNGLLRQFLPRSTNLDHVSQEQLDEIARLLNTRPRKCLKYKTPQEVLQASGAFQS